MASPQDMNSLIAEKITGLLEQDLMHHVLKVEGTAYVSEPEIREKINQWKENVKDVLTKTVCALDDGLDDVISSARYREEDTTEPTAVTSDIPKRSETPLGVLFGSTLVNQATEISASLTSRYLQLPMTIKNATGHLPAKTISNFQSALSRAITRRKVFYYKKMKAFLLDMEEDFTKVLSGGLEEDDGNFSLEEKRLDLILNSNKSSLNVIIAEMKPKDIIEKFWKLFVDKFFIGKVSSQTTESSAKLGIESQLSPYIEAYGKFKYYVNDYLVKDLKECVKSFVKFTVTGNEISEKEMFSSPALISMEHFNELMRKIVEESSRPEKELESESREIINLTDSDEQRVLAKVHREEALELCRSFMQNQREAMIKYVKEQQKSVLTKGFTIENLRRYNCLENVD